MDKDDQQQDDSLRATLDAAFAEKASTTPADDQDQQPAASPPADDKQQPASKAPVAADKPASAQQPAADPAKQTPAPAANPLAPPARWTKEEKEQWEKLTEGLDPATAATVQKIQGILISRNRGMEGEFYKQMQSIATDRQWKQGMDAVLAPFRSTWQKAGIEDTAALKQLLEGFEHSNRDPIGFIRWIAQIRQVDPRQLVSAIYPQALQPAAPAPANPQQAQQPGTPPQLHPEVQRRLDEQAATIQRLSQQLGGGLSEVQQRFKDQEDAQARATAQEAQTSIQQFFDAVDDVGGPKYPFARDLQQAMGALIQSGAADSLEAAYDQAVYANPQTRARIMESRDIQQRREFETRLRDDAKKAKQAAGGLSQSAPVLTGDPQRSDGPPGSIRSALEEAVAAARASGHRRI